MAEQDSIADKNEILTFLTSVMRDSELGEKDRLGAAFRLGKYLGLEGEEKEKDDLPRVVIYDGTAKNKLP